MYRYLAALLAGLLIAGFTGGVGPSRAQSWTGFESPQSTAEWFAWCQSLNPDKQEFCLGYIEATAYHWRVATACRSGDSTEQSFCAGVNAARDRIERLGRSCDDCGPDKLKQLGRDLVEVIGKCSPNGKEGKFYCAGFNLELEMSSLDTGYGYEPGGFDDARTRGLGQGLGDFVMHLFAVNLIHYLQPCIGMDTDARRMLKVLSAFAEDYPELLQVETPTTFVARALFYNLCPGPREDLYPHVEHCTSWSVQEGNLGVVNTCDKTVSVQFQLDDGPVVERTLEPKKRFDTGRSPQGYVFASCLPGYVSSVPFGEANQNTIINSLYHCVRR